MTIRVLMNAGPWLPVPPNGYGGIENIVAALVPELRRRGVHVVLATIGDSRLTADETIFVYDKPQFSQLLRPYNRVMGCAAAHMQRIVTELGERDDIDLVHDHLEAIGPTVLRAMGAAAPPVLHTLHWDLTKHPELYGAFDGKDRIYVNGVSASQLARAPEALRSHSLGHIHLATPLAHHADRATTPDKGDYVVVLGRITAGKGQHIAARLAHATGVTVLLAGPIGPYRQPAELTHALHADPEAARNPDVRYWCDEVMPHVDGHRVRWLGSLGACARDKLLAGATASLFPLQWEEPGGTAVVESLALGTPIVGYRRGCLPELVDEAVTGFLVDPDDEETLAVRLQTARALDPRACRRAAATRFAPAVMAEQYLNLYEVVLHRVRLAERRAAVSA
ncbi:glycosyltransferase [Kibdelosporangium persicum]|uniref:Glycosyltransferase involved in cell wall biosynthesis n=1 Tax=Kibdelosporangium persicum TaxID=2698649 RepID=A0ABX2FKI7_9PSEU|nr:glycosyltransferase [Kibdelosporangium persicum]NRN71387.1 Glycosyltransferase involved in cell wall biosynthesis [Kibdelosporangium persicum]